MTRRALKHLAFLCLQHGLDRDGEHGRVEGRFLVQAQAGTEPCARLRYPRDEFINGFFLMDLRVSARYQRHVAGAELLLYDPIVFRRRLPIDQATAQAMAKTLTKVQKGLATIREAEGWCDDYVTFVFRLGQVFGARVVVVPDDNTSLDSDSYVAVTPETLWAQIHCWREQLGPTADEEGGGDGQTR